MNVNTIEYDNFVRVTWFGDDEPEPARLIATLGLAGEAGEFAEKMKKRLRGDIPGPSNHEMILELGDVLFYLTKLADTFDMNLEGIMRHNRAKLQSRIDRNAQRGSGDDR